LTKHEMRALEPDRISSIGGFLGERFRANMVGRLKNRAMLEEFIGLHERKNYDDWFWMGEQLGKWLDAAAYSCLISQDQELQDYILQVIDRLAACQEEDGYVGITSRIHRNPVRGMQLYEWYYVLHGLIVCYDLLDSQPALDIANKLGRYIIRTWGPDPGQFPLMGRYPGNGHDGGEGTLILEPIVMLGMRTEDQRFIQWGEETLAMWDDWSDRYPESVHTGSLSAMRRVAKGENDVHSIRENIHAHTLHMTLLGLAALYNATGKDEYRDIVLGCIDNIAAKYVFLTGGMSSGERYVPFRYYNPRNDIEVCPQHTWILLLDQALRWTGKATYAEEIERTLFNSFLAAQTADGSNWSYMTPLNGRAQRPGSPNCCNAAGHRIAGRMPVYLYGLIDDGIVAHMYTDSEIEFELNDNTLVRLKQVTQYPSQGSVVFHVEPNNTTRFAFYLRIPSFAEGATIAVNGKSIDGVKYGDYARIEREWKKGDTVSLHLPLRVRAQAGHHEVALVRGPLVYAYFQAWQDDPERFYWSQGLYPDDVDLLIDPSNVANDVVGVPAPPTCLGPALIVKARQKQRAPMFANPEANKRLPQGCETEAVLLPFANQGTRNGHYAVFLGYER
jgi:DUF1680 family protein